MGKADRSLFYLTLEAPREGQASYVHVCEIIAGLERRGWNVTLFRPSYTDSTKPVSVQRRLWEYAVLNARLAAQILRTDVLYIRSHFFAFPAAFVARLLGKPVVQEINGPYEDIVTSYPWTRRIFPLLRWLQRTQFRWADQLIAVTEALKAWGRAEARHDRVQVIPNGANTDLFSPSRRGESTIEGKYVIFFGGLARWHSPELMIAATRSPSWPADVRLVIVGEGQGSPVIQAAADNPRVLALGRRPYTEIGAHVAGALAGLCLIGEERAQSGTFPLKLFEILASGIPAIVTDVPGQADLVRENQCGVVVPLHSPEAIGLAVRQLSEDPQLARSMGDRGVEAIRREHSWDFRAEQTHRNLEALV